MWGTFGRVVMLAGSLLLGVIAGLTGFWIFEMKVPEAMQTRVLNAEARLYYILAGLVLGAVIYLWTRAAAAIAARAALSRGRREADPPSDVTPPSVG